LNELPRESQAPGTVLGALQRLRQSLKSPPITIANY
jgi:hypothetical protein